MCSTGNQTSAFVRPSPYGADVISKGTLPKRQALLLRALLAYAATPA